MNTLVIEKFIQDQFFWKKTKEEKLALLRWEFEQAEEEACKTLYKPEISKNSEILAKNKFNKARDQQVHDRLYNHHEELMSKKETFMQTFQVANITLTLKRANQLLKAIHHVNMIIKLL